MSDSYYIEFVGDRSIQINAGQTILEASLAAGIPHFHACGGKAKCSTCRILIDNGNQFLNDYTEKEVALRKQLPFPKNVRLACQAYVTGPSVAVHRMIRDESDVGIYISDNTNDLDNLGEEKELALFFLDIRHFTPFMEQYLAFDVIHVVRRLFTLFRNSIECHNGQIIETAGDGFYAVFGLDDTIEAAAQHAVDAGLHISKEMENFNNDYLMVHFWYSFDVGIGVHVGNTIMGNIGIGVNNNLTVMGLPVNIASRLQSATKELNNSFLISEDTYALLKHKPSSATTQLSLKGIKDPVKVYLIGKPYQAK